MFPFEEDQNEILLDLIDMNVSQSIEKYGTILKTNEKKHK
jgi:hypothetical protein